MRLNQTIIVMKPMIVGAGPCLYYLYMLNHPHSPSMVPAGKHPKGNAVSELAFDECGHRRRTSRLRKGTFSSLPCVKEKTRTSCDLGCRGNSIRLASKKNCKTQATISCEGVALQIPGSLLAGTLRILVPNQYISAEYSAVSAFQNSEIGSVTSTGLYQIQRASPPAYKFFATKKVYVPALKLGNGLTCTDTISALKALNTYEYFFHKTFPRVAR